MCLPSIGRCPRAAGRPGRGPAPGSRAGWIMESRPVRCSALVRRRSPSPLARTGLAKDGIAMGYGQAPARPPIAAAINGASCRGASSGRWRRGPGRSPSWGPCPVPRRGRAYTGRGLRRQRPSPGFYGRAGGAGCHSGTSAVWATAATAPAKPHGLAVNTAGTSRWSGSVMVMRLGTSPPHRERAARRAVLVAKAETCQPRTRSGRSCPSAPDAPWPGMGAHPGPSPS